MSFLSSTWDGIVNWFKTLWLEQYELTVYFPDQIVTNPDGSTVQGFSPKTFDAVSFKKLTTTHIIFIDTDKKRIEIKVTSPVGYDLKKVY